MSKIQTYIKQKKNYSAISNIVHQFSILVHQFLSLNWTKNLKLILIMVKKKTNYNDRVKITNINSNSNSFTNLINHSYSFSAYLFIHLFIYSLIFENSLNLFLCLHIAIKLHLWFNRLTGSKYNIIFISPSRHKLHLPSKQLQVVDLFNISIEFLELNPYFSTSKIFWIRLFDFSSVQEKTNEYDYYILTSI